MYHTLARILLIERQIESRKCVFQISDTCLSCTLSLVFPRANQIYLSSRCRTSGTPTNSRSRDHCQINRYQSYYYCYEEVRGRRNRWCMSMTQKFCMAISVTGVREILSWTIRKSGSLFRKEHGRTFLLTWDQSW